MKENSDALLLEIISLVQLPRNVIINININSFLNFGRERFFLKIREPDISTPL